VSLDWFDIQVLFVAGGTTSSVGRSRLTVFDTLAERHSELNITSLNNRLAQILHMH